jgi:hypothetical protein
MKKYSFTSGALVLAALLILGPSVTSAEPARNANICDWKDHEPVPSEVQKKEQAAGIAPSSQQQRADDRELENLYRSLLRRLAPTGRDPRTVPFNRGP